MDDATMRGKLAAARVVRLSTVRPDGRPHIVVCCFVLAGEVLYSAVDDKPKMTVALQRLRNLRTNAAVSLLADHYDENWTALWWIRLDGVGRVITDGREHRRAVALLCGKYDQYRDQRPTGPVVAVDISRWLAWP